MQPTLKFEKLVEVKKGVIDKTPGKKVVVKTEADKTPAKLVAKKGKPEE